MGMLSLILVIIINLELLGCAQKKLIHRLKENFALLKVKKTPVIETEDYFWSTREIVD